MGKKWRKETAWWDSLEVTREIREEHPNVFTWLESVAPLPEEHDFVLYTDGSGCSVGWGASAAILEKVDLLPAAEERGVVSRQVLVSGTYGSTVNRRELTAFLDGIHEILNIRAAELCDDPDVNAFDLSTRGPLAHLVGPDRVSVLWYTDRSNLASALLFDEKGSPLQSRGKDRDLWLRYSAMSKHVCVTPMCISRNSNEGQKACDAMCTVAREAMMNAVEELKEAAGEFYKEHKWTLRRRQKALF